MIRDLISRIDRYFSDRMVPVRRSYSAPMKVWFDPEMNTERARDAARLACILGETTDLSRTGIGFVVSSIRSKEKYLVGHDRMLNVEIDLPNGKVFLRMIGKRYKKVGLHLSTEKFLVGAQIISISEQDRSIYEMFLKKGRRAAIHASKTLELEADR